MSIGVQGVGFLGRSRSSTLFEGSGTNESDGDGTITGNNDPDGTDGVLDFTSSTSSPDSLVSLGPQLNNFGAQPVGNDGTPATVTGGSLTLTNGEEESLTAEDGSNLSFTTGEEGTVTVNSSSTGESLTAEPGTDLSLEGDGELTLFGSDEVAGAEGGQSLRLREDEGTIRAVSPPDDTTLRLSESESFLDVESTRPNQTDSLTVFGDAGQTLTFEQGESGTVEEGEDGAVRVTNDDRERSITIEGGFSVLGEAEGTLSGPSGERVNLGKGDELRVSSTDENVNLTQPGDEPTEVTLDSEGSVPANDGPIRFALRGDAETGTFRTLTTNLLGSSETESGGTSWTDDSRGTFGSDDSEESTLNGETDRTTPRESPFAFDPAGLNDSDRNPGLTGTVNSGRLSSRYSFEPAFRTNALNVFA